MGRRDEGSWALPEAERKARNERLLALYDQGVPVAAIAIRYGKSTAVMSNLIGKLKRERRESG